MNHQNRYQIHSCGVTAVDLSVDGELVVSGGVDGGIVVWSSITGFTLQKFTLHCTTIRSVRFSTGGLLGVSWGLGEATPWCCPCRVWS